MGLMNSCGARSTLPPYVRVYRPVDPISITMSREAEQKLLAYIAECIGPTAVAKRLSISEAEVARLASGRSWLSREQTLAVAELIIALAKRASSTPSGTPPAVQADPDRLGRPRKPE